MMNKNHISNLAAVALISLVGCANGSQQGAEARRWSVGDSFVYDVSSARTVSMGDFHSKFDGKLAITVVGEDAEGAYQLRGDVRAPHYVQSPAEDVTQELQMPFYFTALPTGQVKGFRFTRGISSGAAAVQRELALSLQLVREQDASSAAWRSIERDATGEYDAQYTQAGAAIHKSKVHYLDRKGGNAPISGFDGLAVKSSVDFTVNDSLWPLTVTEDESTTATAGKLVVTSTKTSSAKLVAVEKQPRLVGSMESASLIDDAAIDAEARALAHVQADRNLVDGKSFAQIAADLGSEVTQTRNHAQARLAALIRLDPAAAEAAGAEVLAGRGDLNLRKRLIGALGSGGTKEAQHVLVTIAAGSEQAADAIVALGLTKEPTAETASALASAMQSSDRSIASTATLASGSVIRAMTLHASGDTAAAMRTLVAKLAAASAADDKVLYLEALGNTGDARAMAAIQPYLSDEEVSVRASAVGAMKFMSGDAADRAVIAGMSDPEPVVQRAAVRTIQYRPIAAVLPAIQALLGSKVENTVRKAALSGLRAKSQELAFLAENGASEGAKQMAREMLNAR